MTKRKCVHHWKIDKPHGKPEVAGVCKKCGARRKFRTALEQRGWREEFEARME